VRSDQLSSMASTPTAATQWARLAEHQRVGIGAVLMMMVGVGLVAVGFVRLYQAQVVLGLALIVAGCVVSLGGSIAVGGRRT
jgi:hypothetical protein